MNKNIIWIVVIVIIAAALFFIYGKSPATAPTGETPESGSQPAAQAPVMTSDNPDTIVNNILDGSEVAPTPMESDLSLTAADTDITNGFDQAADTSSL